LEKSALNVLTSRGGLKDKDIYESPTYNELSNTQLKNENFNELLNIKFPINNKVFNYMIIDANLAIKENLQNIFLLEFDLNNYNKDNNSNNAKFMKLLREINNNCIEREIFFVLNGTMHGVQMFSSELKFSVEQRKFIKSIQFKLESYKNELISEKQQHPNSPENLKIKNRFFAKILSNTNIGFEFSKPHFNMRTPEKFQTNFNSIVNAKININKFFIEVSIPKVFLCNTNYMDLTRISNINEEDENQIKDINIDKFNDMSNDKTASSLNSNNYINSMNSINNISNNISNNSNNGLNSNSSIINNLNNNGYNSPIFSSLRSDYIYSRSTLRNKQIKIPPLNNDFSTRKDSYQSPHLGSIYPRFVTKDNVLTPDYNYINGNYPLMFGRNLTHNLGVNNFSISGLKNNMSALNNSTFSSSLHFSPSFGFNTNNCIPSSPGGRSYIGPGNQMMFNALNNNQLYPNIQNFELDGGSMLSRQYSQTSIFSDTYNNKSSKSINSDRSYNYQSFGFNTNNYNNKNNLSVRSFGRASYFDEYRSNNIFNIGNNSLSLNLNMNRSYISPRNVSELNFKNLNTSEDKQNMNGIPTILKKIVDWEKKKDEDQEAKEESNKENNNIKNNLNTLFKLKIEEDIKLIRNKTESFTELYDGVCNFLIFLRNATPYITKDKNYIDAFREIKLEHFFKCFHKYSLFGLRVNYLSSDVNQKQTLCNIAYSLSLSSMEISITNMDIILKILDYLIQIKKCSVQIKSLVEENNNQKEQKNMINKNNNYFEFLPCEKNPCLKIILKNLNKITIEYCENKPQFLRKNFYEQIKEILKQIQINDMNLNNISGKSYFSILFSPINQRNKNNIQTSFITYYQFKYSEDNHIGLGKYIELPVIGILPIKLVPKFFLEQINKDQFNNLIYDTIILNNSINNVTSIILNNSNRNSYDVEVYLKEKERFDLHK
jgi:hypothetical protein